jgi:uncharacterized protein YbaR (Trm112 family)
MAIKCCPLCKQPLSVTLKLSAAEKLAIKAAQRKAEWDAGEPARKAAADSEYARVNYYTSMDFANSTDPNAPATPPPTADQWKEMTKIQRDTPGMVLPADLPKV